MAIAVRFPVALGVAVAVGATARKLVHDRAARREAERREFRVHEDEHGADAIRRVVTGQIDDALDRLRAGDGEAIHDARKAFKRARAGLRVGRDAIGKTAYARENAALRDMGRSLAPARDAEVVVETLDALAERNRDRLPPGPFAGLRAALAAEARSAQPAHLPTVIAELEAIRERVASLDGAADDAALTAGFRRIYKRGRRAFRHAREQPEAEALHELRKRAKDLWHAGQILRAPKAVRKGAHELADVLGDEHDLTVLQGAAGTRPEALRPGEPLLLQAIVDDRQDELRREAMERAGRLYAKKPRRVRP
jgi:CHAD domain-containing protein